MSTSNAGASGNAPTENTLQVPTRSHPVVVSLRANVDTSGTVDIFTGDGNQVNNVVVCAVPLDADTLYVDSSKGILEFWEPSSDRGTINGCAQSSTARVHSVLPAGTAAGMHACLQGALDASAAPPFNQYAGVASNAYTAYTTIGELALALHAEYLFGHPAATSAIDNDLALVNFFNGWGGALPTSANLGARITSAINNLSDADATGIVRQVISQDPSRAAGQDNNERTPDVHQCLQFYPGDTIYVSITFKQPAITSGNTSAKGNVGSSATNLPAGSSNAFPAGGAQLTFQITLN